MRASRTAARFLFAVAASACARRHEPKEPAAAAESGTITLERRACFGTCPVYLLTVSADGHVVFEGRRHVDSIGTFTASLGAGQFAALRNAFDDKQFFDLDSAYVMGAPHCSPYATDAPTTITTIATAGRMKRVEHDVGCAGVPPRLGELERAIDQIAGTSRWTGRR